MKAKVQWIDNVSFMAISGSGHAVVVDGPPDHGGRNLGPRPMEMLLMGVGSCSSFDVVSILKKSRQQVVDCHVELTAERADAVPAVFTAIHMRFTVRGYQLRLHTVERAVTLSVEKYCSAAVMLRTAGVVITHETVVETPEFPASCDCVSPQDGQGS